MHILLTLVYFLLFCFLILKLPFFRNVPGLGSPLLLVFFGLKVLAGSLLIFVYTYYYSNQDTADVYKYFNDGKIMFHAAGESIPDYLRMLTGIDASATHLSKYYDQMNFWQRPWDSQFYNDNRLVIRFNALVSLFSFGHIWVHTVFMNFLSFSGLVALYRFASRYTNPAKLFWLAPGIFLFPSLLFWGSGVLKEGLLLWAFGFWMLHVDRLVCNLKPVRYQLLYVLVFSFVLLLLKPYTLFLWIPCMLAFYISKGMSTWRIQVTYVVMGAAMVAAALVFSRIFPGYDLLQMIASKQNDFIKHSLLEDAGSLMHTRYLSADILEIAREFFLGFFYTLFRPYLWEAYSVVTLVAAIENTIVMFMIIYMVVAFKKDNMPGFEIKWLAIWFVVFLMGFVGMVSPAFGGLVRYKITALPFLWIFFIHMAKLPEINTDSIGFPSFLKQKNKKPL